MRYILTWQHNRCPHAWPFYDEQDARTWAAKKLPSETTWYLYRDGCGIKNIIAEGRTPTSWRIHVLRTLVALAIVLVFSLSI